jgi:spore germination cell wall hydrolase CwlJ-like protein
LARAIYWGFTEDPTQGALWFHAENVRPSWRSALLQGPRIGRHVFYGRARLDS